MYAIYKITDFIYSNKQFMAYKELCYVINNLHASEYFTVNK